MDHTPGGGIYEYRTDHAYSTRLDFPDLSNPLPSKNLREGYVESSVKTTHYDGRVFPGSDLA
jgi:hypothetical protein